MSHLKGMLAISKYADRTESTILEWWRSLKFPMTKISPSNIWESDTEMIDAWRLEQLKKSVQEVERPALVDVSKRPGLKNTVQRRGKK